MRLLRDLVGETLSGRYRIVSRIAGGGMGEVYRGHDLLLDRTVAVKVLMPSLANDPDLVARFKAEARAAAKLNHPNVVAVHDWGTDDERTYYMVMEYVSGTDLRELLVGRGPMDPAHAADIVASVCDALQAAHSSGLIHRDIKPENVLIARDGTVKVADLGIAAIADAERTMPGGGIMGTLRYLSPEQAGGAKASEASDIWAAGALLFELLTGSSPQGGTGAELLRRRAQEPIVPPSSLEPDVPAELDDIVVRACAIDPAQRFIDAASMARALRAARPTIVPRSKPAVADLFRDLTSEVALSDTTTTGSFDLSPIKRAFTGGGRVRQRRLFVASLAVLLLVLGAWRGATAIFGAKEVDVPKLTGMSLQAATSEAEDAGFEIRVVDSKRDEDVEEGDIISQTPADGVLMQGEFIDVVVSKGPPLVKIPDLAGKSEEVATAQLTGMGLIVEASRYEFSVEQEEGDVIRVVSPSKKIEEGTPVYLLVSKGPRSLVVPDVIGMKLDKAVAAIEGAGFVAVPVEVFSEDVEPGFVVSTNPSATAEAPEASDIEIAISKGPEFKELTMPDVRNMSVDAARTKLEGMGLTVQVNQSCPGSTVIETDPLPGSTVREGDVVRLFVC
jgi:eukaryotic-like serine/threonine-protein kinase